MLSALYPVPPHDISGAIDKAHLFLNGGESGGGEEETGPRLYSFSKDARLIYAAFKQTHGVDLEKESIHWWKFLALFMDLGSETTFCQLVSLRKRIKTGKATKEERAAVREMGDVFDIPEVDTRSIEAKEAEDRFMRLVRERQMKHGG
jgi:hypothetical protein